MSGEILPDVFPVVSAGVAAVPVSLPVVDEMVASAVVVEEAAPVGVPPVEGDICLSETYWELDVFPVVSAGAVAVPVSLPVVDWWSRLLLWRMRFLLWEWLVWEAGRELPVELLYFERVSQDCCVVDDGVVVPEKSPVVSIGAAAVADALSCL